MNNPFLTDRNIFSKVVNPIKKKSDQEKKDEPINVAGSVRPVQKAKEPIAANYNFYKNQKSSDKNLAGPSAVSSLNPPASKMTFGIPMQSDNKASFDRNLLNNPRSDFYQRDSNNSNSQSNSRQIQILEPYKLPENIGNNYSRQQFNSMSMEYEVRSPNQQYKFEQYRKQNNMKEVSPIIQQFKKGNDSQFFNLDRIGDDDLNKFLAESKNQEEICKMLGIQRNIKRNDNAFDRNSAKIDYRSNQNKGYMQQFRNDREEYRPSGKQNFNPPYQDKSNLQIDNSKGNQKYHKSYQIQKAFQPRVQSTEALQQPSFVKKPSGPPQLFQKFKPEPKMNENQKPSIPTFNYMSLDHYNQEQSREQDIVPTFKVVQTKTKKNTFEASKSSQQSDINDNLEVFNYSQPVSGKQESSLQEAIRKQMQLLSLNGKYRTFLTASEKIVTVRYRLAPL